MKKYLITGVALVVNLVVFAQYTSPQDIAAYKQQAADGDISAMGFLADMYANGQERVPKDCAQALKYYNMAIDKGDSSYLISLGKLYLYGNCETQHYDSAAYYFSQAAQQRQSQGFFNMGAVYETGMGRPANYDRALQWYMKTAMLGKEQMKGEGIPADGGYLLFDMLSDRINTMYKSDTIKQFHPIDIGRTLQAFTDASGKGNKYAMMALYIAYLNGDGTVRDTAVARTWLLKAAKAGNVYAMYHMGLMDYSKGLLSTNKDNAVAVKWFLKCADSGYVEGMTHLAIIYFYGWGVMQDTKKGMQWFLKAAAKGDALAMNNIGVAYMTGQSVKMDYKTGLEWITKAAMLNYTDAMFYLARAYENGVGTNQDFKQAMEWYMKAAANGNETAMDAIGRMYENGEGVQVDYKKAVQWYAKIHRRK